MAQPIALQIPPRDPADELQVRLEAAPVEHAQALLAGYEVLQALHDQGVLDILRSGVAAKDQILDIAATAADKPATQRAIRNLLILTSALAAVEPDRLKTLIQIVSRDEAQTKPTSKPVGFWGLLRRIRSKDSLRAMATGMDFLEAFGRYLRSTEDAPEVV